MLRGTRLIPGIGLVLIGGGLEAGIVNQATINEKVASAEHSLNVATKLKSDVLSEISDKGFFTHNGVKYDLSNPENDFPFASFVRDLEVTPLRELHSAFEYRGVLLDKFFVKSPFNLRMSDVLDLDTIADLYTSTEVERSALKSALIKVEPELIKNVVSKAASALEFFSFIW